MNGVILPLHVYMVWTGKGTASFRRYFLCVYRFSLKDECNLDFRLID